MAVGSALIYLLAQGSGTDILMGTMGILGTTGILMGTTGIAGGINSNMLSAQFRPDMRIGCLESRTPTVWERLSNQFGTICVGPDYRSKLLRGRAHPNSATVD